MLEIINGCVGLCYVKLMSEHPEIDILMEMFNYYNTEEHQWAWGSISLITL